MIYVSLEKLQTIVLVCMLFLSSFSTIIISARGIEEQELFYDDGEMDWSESLGGTAGYAVKFSPPMTSSTIDKVEIYGCYEPASSGNNFFWLDIWDANLKVLYEGVYRYADCFNYRGLGGFYWATIEIPEITVYGDFYVAFFPRMIPGQAYLWMGMDFDPPISGRSFFTDREQKYLQDPSESVSPPREWMIRVILSPQPSSPSLSPPTTSSVDVAEKAAVYVANQAVFENGGYKWLVYDASGSWERPSDVAKIGLFFASLYQSTQKATYLNYAKGAAQWIITKAVSERGGYKWACPDKDIKSPGWWLNTVVWEVGEFLLEMYKLTGNTTYLTYAKGAAQWMVAMAEPEAAGYFIPYNPPGKTGSQASHGIMPGREAMVATFLLHMYRETGNSTYLYFAKETAEWLMTGPDIKSESGGYTWVHNRPYGTAYVIASGYNPGGTAGVANFFYEIYQVAGNATYLNYANGAIQWILSKAEFVNENSLRWPRIIGRGDYPIIIGIPPFTKYATMSDLLLYAYAITGNSTYLEYAKKHLNWILSEAISKSGGYVWKNNENAYDNSMIYWSLCNAFQNIKDNLYMQYATEALNWIINNATSVDGGYKWKIVTYNPFYPWWFINGASGIGYYLTKISSVSNAPPLTRNILHVSVFKQNELQKIIESVKASAFFTITQVSVEEFNQGNPSDLSVYDAIVFGINDWGEVAGNRSRKYSRLNELEAYVNNGGGIIWTHDTLEQWWDYGIQIEDPAGVDNYDISDKNKERVWYSSVKIVDDHEILHSPFEIGSVGDTIDIQYTHTNGGRVNTAKAIIKSYNGKYESQATDANDFYLTINDYGKGRVAVIEVGHSTIKEDKPTIINIPSEKESKIFVNTLYWVSSARQGPGVGLSYTVNYLFSSMDVESGGVLNIYFQVLKHEVDGSVTPANGVPVKIQTSSGSMEKTSENYLNVDGIAHFSFSLPDYSGYCFSVYVEPSTFNGVPVYPPSVNPILWPVKPREALLHFSTSHSYEASLGVGVQGSLFQGFSLNQDGENLYGVSFSEKAKSGLKVDYHPFEAKLGVAHVQVGGEAGGGVIADLNYGVFDPSNDTQVAIVKYLITKWILTNARVAALSLPPVVKESTIPIIEGLYFLVLYDLARLGADNYVCCSELGGYGYASVEAEASVGLSSEKGSAKNTIGKIGSIGVSHESEIAVSLVAYSDGEIGVRGEASFNVHVGAGVGLNMGFLNLSAGTTLVDAVLTMGAEIIYKNQQPSTLNVDFSIEGSRATLESFFFSGLISALNRLKIPSTFSHGKLTLILSMPIDKLPSNLAKYLKDLVFGEINLTQFLNEVYDEIADTPTEYEVRASFEGVNIPVNIGLKICGVGLGLEWDYQEYPEVILEKGFIWNWQKWTIVQYDSIPKSMNTLQFLRDYYVPTLSGIVIQLNEKTKHLYLHVYDSQGRHVGLNYETGQVENEIPDSYYFDNKNGTIAIVLPLNLTDFRIEVDGRYAMETTEKYNLTTVVLSADRANYTQIFASITKGETQVYNVAIPPTGPPTITKSENPWWVQHQLWIITGVIVTVAALTVFTALIKKRKAYRSQFVTKNKVNTS